VYAISWGTVIRTCCILYIYCWGNYLNLDRTTFIILPIVQYGDVIFSCEGRTTKFRPILGTQIIIKRSLAFFVLDLLNELGHFFVFPCFASVQNCKNLPASQGEKQTSFFFFFKFFCLFFNSMNEKKKQNNIVFNWKDKIFILSYMQVHIASLPSLHGWASSCK
jgi:hypothetical protein